MEIYNWECLHLFSIQKSLQIPRTICQHYLFSNGNLFIFHSVLKSDKLEGMLQRGNLGIFFILLNEHHLNQGVFIDIEQFKKCVA